MDNAHDLILLYVPCGSEEEATGIARALLEERLIACANVYPSRSLYRWQGKVADEIEHVLICKTSKSRANAAEKRILDMHSYELPCVLQIQPAGVNHAYARWVVGEVSSTRGEGDAR